MPQETNEAARPDEKYRISVEAVLEQYQTMYSKASYDLALAQAGVDQLARELQAKSSLIEHLHETETRITNEIGDLTDKLDEAERLMREQGQIIERYRMAYGNPPELVVSDENNDYTDGQSVEVQDGVFSGKAERKVAPRKRA